MQGLPHKSSVIPDAHTTGIQTEQKLCHPGITLCCHDSPKFALYTQIDISGSTHEGVFCQRKTFRARANFTERCSTIGLQIQQAQRHVHAGLHCVQDGGRIAYAYNLGLRVIACRTSNYRLLTYMQAFSFENTRRARNGPCRIKQAGHRRAKCQ